MGEAKRRRESLGLGDAPIEAKYRRDIVTLFKEQIARFEGQPELRGNA